MVKHIVMWRFKEEAEGATKADNIAKATKLLESMPPKISELKSLEVGKNYNTSDAAYDLVLITTHSSAEELNNYVAHPFHQEVAGFIKQVVAARVVVDFEF